MSILEARGLQKYFPIKSSVLRRTIGHVRAVDGIDFSIGKGEAVGIVGESGCGKSTLGRLLVCLTKPTGGALLFDGMPTSGLSRAAELAFRRKVQIVFQNPFASLDSRQTIGQILRLPLSIHRRPGNHRALVASALERVGLAATDAEKYPHEFSGGQRQRIAIARALMLDPEVIVCDEATSALDVSVQAQIIALLESLHRENGVSLIFISHNLSVVERLCDRIMVMYLGRVMETAETERLFDVQAHPYTKALLGAIPFPDPLIQKFRGVTRLEGAIPSPANPPSGCPFRTRCPEVFDICKATRPELVTHGPTGHGLACHLPSAEAAASREGFLATPTADSEPSASES